MIKKRNILSKREQDVIQLLAKGYNSKRIGEELQITEATVQTHRRNMLRKLKVHNSTELISWAYRVQVL